VRRRGGRTPEAVNDEENGKTICCLGVPVLDAAGRPAGAVSVSTVVFLVSRPELERYAPTVTEAAGRIARPLRCGVDVGQ